MALLDTYRLGDLDLTRIGYGAMQLAGPGQGHRGARTVGPRRADDAAAQPLDEPPGEALGLRAAGRGRARTTCAIGSVTRSRSSSSPTTTGMAVQRRSSLITETALERNRRRRSWSRRASPPPRPASRDSITA
jgi:hypothetical protein